MSTTFRPGDRVFWWKPITREVDYPYKADVVAVGAKRVTITSEDPNGGLERVLRHARTECLQEDAGYSVC
jgi:hypothetical protein